jgi:hypothetical protein
MRVKPRIKFVAPQIDPPADLIPAYLPEGFKLVQGFQTPAADIKESFFSDDSGDSAGRTHEQLGICLIHLPGIFSNLKSPASNDILGVVYQDGSHLLMITKSYFPGGSLDLWRASYEGDVGEQASVCDCTFPCDCLWLVNERVPSSFPSRFGEIQEVRTVGATQVAIVDQGLIGLTAVFMRGDYLLTVESDFSLEEILKTVESLLQ